MPTHNTYTTVGVVVTTTDATVDNSTIFVTQNDRGYLVEARIIAQEQDAHDETNSYILSGTFQNDGGTLTQISTDTVIHSKEGTSGWDATLEVSSPNLIVRLTGASSTTIKWRVALDILSTD